jgi:hypothetical protein
MKMLKKKKKNYSMALQKLLLMLAHGHLFGRTLALRELVARGIRAGRGQGHHAGSGQQTAQHDRSSLLFDPLGQRYDYYIFISNKKEKKEKRKKKKK